MTLSIHLTRDLEQFARACVDTGRYDSMSAVVREGLKLLREVEERRRAVIDAAAAAGAEAVAGAGGEGAWEGAESGEPARPPASEGAARPEDGVGAAAAVPATGADAEAEEDREAEAGRAGARDGAIRI